MDVDLDTVRRFITDERIINTASEAGMDYHGLCVAFQSVKAALRRLRADEALFKELWTVAASLSLNAPDQKEPAKSRIENTLKAAHDFLYPEDLAAHPAPAPDARGTT